jgi:hypothetical protein
MTVDVARVQTATLLMHFDASWVERLLRAGGDRALPLSDDERALFASVDVRGFRADALRAARAVFAVVDELPVSAAIVGLPKLFAFLRHDAFVDVCAGRASLVEGAAAFIEGDARTAVRIERAVARAHRRKRRFVGRAAAGVGVVVDVDAGSLAHYGALRAALAPRPTEAVGQGQRLQWTLPATSEREHVLVQAGALSTCSGPLARLVDAACVIDDAAALVARAIALGCDDVDDARALLHDLAGDGLLRAA